MEKNKFGVVLKEAPKLCRICYTGLSSKSLNSHANSNNKVNYAKFCEVIKYSGGGKGYSLCDECILVVNSAMRRKSKVDEVEGEVRRLQLEVLKQLRRLQQELHCYYEEMEKVKMVVVEKEEVRSTPLAGKISVMEQLERKETDLFRYRIVDAVCDLRIFQTQIGKKLVHRHDGNLNQMDADLSVENGFGTTEDVGDKPDIKREVLFDGNVETDDSVSTASESPPSPQEMATDEVGIHWVLQEEGGAQDDEAEVPDELESQAVGVSENQENRQSQQEATGKRRKGRGRPPLPHDQKLPHQCDVCLKFYPNRNAKFRCMEKHLNMGKRFRCSCGRNYNRKDNRDNHCRKKGCRPLPDKQAHIKENKDKT